MEFNFYENVELDHVFNANFQLLEADPVRKAFERFSPYQPTHEEEPHALAFYSHEPTSDQLMLWNSTPLSQRGRRESIKDFVVFKDSIVFAQNIPFGGSRTGKELKQSKPEPPRLFQGLEIPLSELTKHSSTPLVNIQAYVTRTGEQRWLKVGKVGRPSNAFILYRKAFFYRAREICVEMGLGARAPCTSKLIAESWRLESENVRNQYFAFAALDKENHQKTYPEYRYVPVRHPKRKADEIETDEYFEVTCSKR